jgi:predicted O-linked N-acetylglucosamine transferase (SPINDLY family)
LGIDILVECDGYFRGGARLPVFAVQAATVQIALSIYPGTTGVRQIDFQITDAAIDPAGSEAWHNERLLRVPNALCYQPNHDDSPVPELPALQSGAITFGSLSLPAKINERVVDCWAAILRAVPSSTLLLQHFLDRPGRRDVNDAIRRRFLRLFSDRGVAPARIRLLGNRTHAEHMCVYNSIDIALDPFPYNGTLTTLNALNMGVPVITLAGTTSAGRVGCSLLDAIGLGRLVARDTEQYCRLAIETARDLAELRRLRAELRPLLAASPLMDSRGYASSLEQAYVAAWNAS